MSLESLLWAWQVLKRVTGFCLLGQFGIHVVESGDLEIDITALITELLP
jgi:hypothetical protein